MSLREVILTFIVLAGALTACTTTQAAATVEAASTPLTACPVTRPPDLPFIPPAPYSTRGPHDSTFWYGSAALWTQLPEEGIWRDLPHSSEGFSQKLFWWREGYVWNEEPQPDLIVTGELLDAAAPPLTVSQATNAYAADIGSAMLAGVQFPLAGCWKITGTYAGTALSFVVQVDP